MSIFIKVDEIIKVVTKNKLHISSVNKYVKIPVAKVRPSGEKHIPVTASPWPFKVFKSNG